ncbi:hypothetical protein BGZ60DRAFT_189387 [Tricladium varicosporioides]|nr:hypothetical protein BGZ60DRAFT_189387 [Hymenoscyphus varicosporioides]
MNSNFNPEAFSLLGVGLSVIGFRFALRASSLGVRGLRIDDYLMLVVACLYAGHTTAAYYVGVFGSGLTNAAMTTAEREALSHFPDSKEYKDRVGGSVTQLLVWVVYSCLLWICKMCMLFFYWRLTENVDHMRWRVKAGFFILPATFMILICVELFGCMPFYKKWQIYPDPGETCYPSHSMPNLYTMIILNVTTDLYLMFIPLPMIWKSGLPTRTKVGLHFMFGFGAIVTTVAFLCCFFIITAGTAGAARAGQWSVRESFLIILCTNIPIIHPFASKLFHHISSTLGSKLSSSKNSRESYRLTFSPGVSFGSLGKKKVRSPYSIPGESQWEKTVWDRTVNGEREWHETRDSQEEFLGVPMNKTDIETGGCDDKQRVAMASHTGEMSGIVVVSTEIGVRSDEGSMGRRVGSPKPAIIK